MYTAIAMEDGIIYDSAEYDDLKEAIAFVQVRDWDAVLDENGTVIFRNGNLPIPNKKIRATISDILWDIDEEDEEDVDLPYAISHEFIVSPKAEEDVISDMISDWLSDTYGYCHGGFQLLITDVDENEDEEVG